MPVELSDLLGNERWVEVEVAGVSLRVAYRPSNTSLKRQAQLQKKMRALQNQTDADEEEQANEAGRLFCEMVSNWDLTDKGEPLPITPEIATNLLPGIVVNAIMGAIGGDAQSQQEEKKALSASLDAGSPAAGRQEVAQNGIPSSEPRATWAR